MTLTCNLSTKLTLGLHFTKRRNPNEIDGAERKYATLHNEVDDHDLWKKNDPRSYWHSAGVGLEYLRRTLRIRGARKQPHAFHAV